MASDLSKSARRVQEFMTTRGFSFCVQELSGSTRTAREAAASIGCEVAQIAKSLVFKEKNSGRPILVIASGSNQVDLKKIAAATGLKLGSADADYVKARVGYAIGGVPPVGHAEPLETLLDPDLKKYEVIWAAAGSPFAVFQLKPADLAQLTRGTWIDLARIP